jgi:hypothetical protein
MRNVWSVCLVVFGLLASAASGGETLYRDPDGAFSISIPSHWKVSREAGQSIDTRYLTAFRSEKREHLRFAVLTQPINELPTKAKTWPLTDRAKGFIDGWVGVLQNSAKVKPGKIEEATFNGMKAAKCELSYTRGDRADPRTGYMYFLWGDSYAVLLFAAAPASDAAARREVDDAARTFTLEPT